ncbi:MAG: hypothetical protein AB7U29_11415 [Desulfobulbus sp.]
MADEKIVCPTCGGSGEIGFFQGESRFFITREECPACCGVGYVLEDGDEVDSSQEDASDSHHNPKKS